MKEFLLILKGDGMNHMSPNELQTVMTDYKSWVAKLGENYVGGQRLEDSGALHKDKVQKIATDGPFLESKEIIAGYFIVKAKNLEEANKIAQSSPHLGLYQIEVRPFAYPKMD